MKRPRVNPADEADLLENLLTGQHPVPSTRHPAPVIRNTGRHTAPQPVVDMRVRHTGAQPIITRTTGTVPTSNRVTGTVPTSNRVTGTVPTSNRVTGAVPISNRVTGTVPTSNRVTGAVPTSKTASHDVRVTRTTSRHTSKHTQAHKTAPLIYSEDSDLYLYNNQAPSLIYTAGTNIIWVTLILILVWLGLSITQQQDSANASISNFNPVISAFMKPVGIAVNNLITIPELPSAPATPRDVPVGESSVLGKPTISAQRIDEILRMYQSPAQGTGQAWIDAGLAYGIDPVYALAFFMHESGMGTNPAWAGIKPDGTTTHNVGNIICAGYPTCYGRFRDYPDWESGIRDWFRLISVEYVEGRGVYTVDTIIPVYAPTFENDVPGYIASVKQYVAQWQIP